MPRGRLKSQIGFVVGDKMDKTVVVDVARIKNHPRYRKPLKWSSTFKAHDDSNQCVVGDKVLIVETKPVSKTKRWRVSKVIEKAKQNFD